MEQEAGAILTHLTARVAMLETELNGLRDIITATLKRLTELEHNQLNIRVRGGHGQLPNDAYDITEAHP